MKKFLIVLSIVLLIALLLVLGFFYLKDTYVPKTLRALLEKSLIKHTNLSIAIDSINYELFKGVVIKNLTLLDSQNQKALSAKEVRFNIMLVPSLEGKRVIIPALFVEEPKLYVNRSQTGSWNFQGFLKEPEQKDEGPAPFILAKLKVISGSILVTDSLDPNFTAGCEKLNLDIAPGKIDEAVFKLSSEVLINKKPAGIMDGKGSYVYRDKKFLTEFELSKAELAGLFNYLAGPQITSERFYSEKTRLNLSYSRLLNELELELKGRLSNANFKKDALSVQTEATIDLSGKLPTDKQFDLKDLSSSIGLFNTRIENIAKLGTVKKISADISLKNGVLNSENIQGQWKDNKFAAKAQAVFGPASFFKAEVESEKLAIIDLVTAFGKNFSQLKDISGKVNLKASLQGPLEFKGPDTDTLQYMLSGSVINAGFNALDSKYKVTSLTGNFALRNNNLILKGFKAAVGEVGVDLEAEVNDFKAPVIKAAVKTPVFSSNLNAHLEKENLFLDSLVLITGNSRMKTSGTIGLKDWQADLKADGVLELSSLPVIFTPAEPFFKKARPKGTISLLLKFKGPLSDILLSYLEAEATSSDLNLFGLSFGQVNSRYTQNKNIVQNFRLDSRAYGGSIEIKGSGDLDKANRYFSANLEVKDIDVAKLKADTNLKDKELKGTLSAKSNLVIDNFDIKTLSGNGEIYLKKGSIWGIKPFRGMAEFLLIPEFTKIEFKEASATFQIKEEKIFTEDLILKSSQLDIRSQGALSFSGGLDFDAVFDFNPDYLKHSSDLRKVLTNLFAGFNQFIKLKVSGTIAKPEYKLSAGSTVKGILNPLTAIFGVE